MADVGQDAVIGENWNGAQALGLSNKEGKISNEDLESNSFLEPRDVQNENLPEIFECLFNWVDMKTLKACRLVNKFWNEEACRVLRKISRVPLNESCKEELDEFAQIFEITKLHQLPFPFKNFHVTIDRLGGALYNILSHPKVCIDHLYLSEYSGYGNKNFQRNLFKILAKNGENLGYFRCTLKEGMNLSWNDHAKLPLYLPALTDFGFWEWDNLPKFLCVDFLCEIIDSAPNLRKLSPGSLDETILVHILSRNKLKKIEELFIENATKLHFDVLSSIHLPQMKSLWIDVYFENIEENRVKSEILQMLVRNFSETLEDLSISWVSNSPDTSFPACPKLKSFALWGWNGSLDVFSEKNMPLLKNLRFKSFPVGVERFDLNPHQGVETLALECNYTEEDQQIGPEIDDEYVCFFEYVRDQYPFLSSIDLTLAVSNDIVTAIIRLFPQLKSLALDTEYQLSEHVFTGVNMLTLQRCLSKGIPMDSLVPIDSLVKLKCLKILILGRYNLTGLSLTNNAIKYGLGKLLSLEVLHLNWNSDLSVDVVSENLKHLNKFVVNNSEVDLQPSGIMDALCQRLPQTVLRSNECMY